VSLESPAALWGLASLALLAIFSLWRQAAGRATVPSLLLWKRIPERNPPIRALRRPKARWELLLQALAVAAAVLALAGPFVASEIPRPRRVALVLDTSARLRQGGRIDRIREEALRLYDGPLSGDRRSVFAAAPSPRRLDRAGLAALGPVDEHVDLEPLLAAARQAADHVLLLSDRAPAGVDARLFGSEGGNVGITALSVGGGEIFARIANHGAVRDVALVVRIDGRETAERISLPAGGERAWSRKADLGGAESVALELETGDGFPLDDRAGAVRLGTAEATATVTGSRDPDVLRALGAVEGVKLRSEGEALVSVGVDAVPGPASFRVRIHTPLGASPGSPVVLRHPLTAGLESRASELGRVGELPPEARGGDPLIAVGERRVAVLRGTELHVCVDLDPARGWPAFPSFPIFWANVVDFARKGAGEFAVLRTGRPFALPPGSAVAAASEPGAIWSLSDSGDFLAHTAGDYLVRRAGGERRLPVGLLDARESDTAGETRSPGWDPARPEGREPEPARLGGWAAGAALGALLLAWLLERRRD